MDPDRLGDGDSDTNWHRVAIRMTRDDVVRDIEMEPLFLEDEPVLQPGRNHREAVLGAFKPNSHTLDGFMDEVEVYKNTA